PGAHAAWLEELARSWAPNAARGWHRAIPCPGAGSLADRPVWLARSGVPAKWWAARADAVGAGRPEPTASPAPGRPKARRVLEAAQPTAAGRGWGRGRGRGRAGPAAAGPAAAPAGGGGGRP